MNLAKQHSRIVRFGTVKLPASLICAAFILGVGSGHSACRGEDAIRRGGNQAIARRILADQDLRDVLGKARSLLVAGFNAGDGYSQVWIRDFNTFIELSCEVNDRATVRANLLKFFEFQGEDGDVPDGFVKANDSYTIHKNTVETDQETSLVQATYKYIQKTTDTSILTVVVNGKTVRKRLELALEFLMTSRFSEQYGLLWGATTVDWGDVQPESTPGVDLDESTHQAIDIYDNSMFLIAVSDYLSFVQSEPKQVARWTRVYRMIRKNARKCLWDHNKNKFIPHVYLRGSPFPPDFDEGKLYYHGGTAVAIEAGLLSKEEICDSLSKMMDDVKKSGAPSIGLTLYPVYPQGFFQNPIMAPYSYQNGGDWSWFGGRMIQEMIRHGLVEDAYREIHPMIKRVQRDNGFYEWYTVANKPMGSGRFRGAAGVLGRAIEMLLSWAETQAEAARQSELRP